MSNDQLKKELLEAVAQASPEIYDLSDFMWDHPELGLEEFQASRRIQKIFEANGFDVTAGIGGMPTAFVAKWDNGGVKVGINVEFDCLPGLSQERDCTAHQEVQKGAPGQGCGHNVLGPATVLAGISLKRIVEKNNLPISIYMFGTPFEESSVGKPVMGKAGVFDGIDFFLDWHPMDYNRADVDTCLSVFSVNYSFKGKTCHGAMPWEGRSALDAAMLFGNSLEFLREHIIPGPPDAAHTINYTFSDTGPAFANIVPDTAGITLYGRFNSLDVAKDAYRRIELCAKGAAIATETEYEQRLITFTHPKIPNRTLAEVVHRNLEELGGPVYTEEEQNFVKELQKNSGMEADGLETGIAPFRERNSIITDASEYSWNAPYATFELAMGPKGGWHNWRVTACAGSSIGKKCLTRAAEIIGVSAIDIGLDSDLLDRAKQEWKERLGGQTYSSLIPDDYTPPLGTNRGIMQRYFPENYSGKEI